MLLLGIVSHAHATEVTVWENLATLLNENPGVSLLVTVVIYIAFHIIKIVFYIIKFGWQYVVYPKWKTMESDVSELKRKFDIMQFDIDKMKTDISNTKDNINKIVKKLFPKAKFLILRESPLRITDTGKNVVMKIGADKLLTKYWDHLKGKVEATKPRGIYDIDTASIEVAQEMYVILSDEEKDIIKTEAFEQGVPYQEILSLIGVMLRDKLLEEQAAAKIMSNPKDPKAYYSRGNTRSHLGKFQDAISDYDKAIELNPDFLEAYVNRGNAKIHLNNLQDAIIDYDEAIRLNPKDAEAYNSRGAAKSELDKFLDDAISDFNEAIRLNPEYWEAYYNRGTANETLGNKKDAVADFTKAKKLNPELDILDLQSNL